jgi:N-acetylmuramoyl-L-alanine amidase
MKTTLTILKVTAKNELNDFWESFGAWMATLNFVVLTLVTSAIVTLLMIMFPDVRPAFALLGFIFLFCGALAITQAVVTPVGAGRNAREEAKWNSHDLCAAVLVLEAGGEGERGMWAVKNVIAERTRQRGWGLFETLVENGQFESLRFTSLGNAIHEAKKHDKWALARIIASADTSVNDPRLKATHFCRSNTTPYWAEGHTPVAIIGHHAFYRLQYP